MPSSLLFASFSPLPSASTSSRSASGTVSPVTFPASLTSLRVSRDSASPPLATSFFSRSTPLKSAHCSSGPSTSMLFSDAFALTCSPSAAFCCSCGCAHPLSCVSVFKTTPSPSSFCATSLAPSEPVSTCSSPTSISILAAVSPPSCPPPSCSQSIAAVFRARLAIGQATLATSMIHTLSPSFHALSLSPTRRPGRPPHTLKPVCSPSLSSSSPNLELLTIRRD
mmetsp:Transcript_52839/g.77390  ORF Transcript_52839/g.77390 Transcript_52839/m.77390 type:complete len:224 (-) Transcript_52839:328-999(-)